MGRKRVFALLIHEKSTPWDELRIELRKHLVETWGANSCQEASRLIEQTQPELIFTDTHLSDGSWVDVVNIADRSYVPTNVIVIGSHLDTQLYISAMQHGAFDFIVPPFETGLLAHVLRAAVENVRHRREAEAVRVLA